MAANDEIRAKDIVPHKTSFSAGDGFYGDGDSSFFMEADDLLRLNAKNATEKIALSFIKMEQGGIISDGSLVSNSIRIRSADYIAGDVKLVAPAGFRFISIFYYDENTLSFSSSVDINKEANIGSAGYVAKFTMAKTDTSQNITPEEVQLYNDRFAFNDELNAVKTETENLRKDDYSISTALVWNEGFVNWHNGNTEVGSGYSYCDKVEIDSFVYNKLVVYAKASDEGNAGIAFYDENDVFLYGEPHFGGTGTSVQMSQHTIPQNAKYFSFSTKTDSITTSRYILDGSIEEAIDAVGDYNANPFESQFVSYGIDSSGNYYESDYFWALKNPLSQNVEGFWIADGYKATIVKTNKSSGVVTRDVWKTSSDGYYKLNHDVYAYRVYVSKISEVLNSTYSGVYALIFKRVGCVAVREDIDELHEADRYYHTLAKCAIKRKYEIGFANSDDYLHLATYDGSGQFVHPKVLYKDAGIFGHKYWMAYTPYPNADVSKENPCIAYSDDGVNWTNISANPLDLPDDNGTVNYNSDTHLVYREDTKTLECWYRNADSTNQVEKIYRRTTTDGVNWSARELLKQTNGLSNLLSPAIIYDADNHKYKIWVVCASGGYHLDYYESTSGDSWSFVKELHFTFEYNSETYTLWHVDVDWIDNRYRVLCMCDDADGVGMLFYTSSYSNANYDTPVPVMVGRAGRWDLRLYRSCLVKCGNMYRIYYSGVNKVTGTREYRVGISESDELGKFVGFVID